MLRIVHVVDDDEAVRRTTARTLSSAGFVPECYSSGNEFLARLETAQPGCILLDLRMPGLCGLSVQSALLDRQVDWPILVLTGYADLSAAVTALKNGALEFLQKPCRRGELVPALETGFRLLKARLQQVRRVGEAKTQISSLSPRELSVLHALADGMSHKVVAHHLGISIRTVEVHRARLLAKLGVRTLSEALRISFSAAMPARLGLPAAAFVDSPN
ncbi:MAG TPA: response regulator [Sphingomicrobium sp.]|nr:response regulator [Sphingomicrobium sp.]